MKENSREIVKNKVKNNKTPTCIKRIRILQGYTQTLLATRVNLCQSAICQIENGTRNPSLNTLNKISKVLNVSIGELLEGEIVSEEINQNGQPHTKPASDNGSRKQKT